MTGLPLVAYFPPPAVYQAARAAGAFASTQEQRAAAAAQIQLRRARNHRKKLRADWANVVALARANAEARPAAKRLEKKLRRGRKP